MTFSGLMSRWLTPASWQAWTAAHIWANMDAIRRTRDGDSSSGAGTAASSDGVGGV